MIDLITAGYLGLSALAGIHGTVRGAGHGPPAEGIRIQLDGIDRGKTDSVGHYAFVGLPTGEHEFRFVGLGFASRRIMVILVDGSDLDLDVELTPGPVVLPPITALADAVHFSTSPSHLPVMAVPGDPGHYRMAPGWQADQPALGTDLQQLIANLPGVSTRGDNPSGLSIRGGQGSENQLLLDGIPLLGASHFAGASSGVNPDAIAAVDVHTGVNSVRYDGSLSGVVELQTTDVAPSRLRISGSATISDVRSLIESPLGRGGLLVGVRASFRDLLTDASRLGVSNGYQDVTAVARVPLGTGTLRLVAFGSGNRMRWEPFGSNDDTSLDDPNITWSNSASWRSGALGATWTQSLGAKSSWHAASWWSGSQSLISSVATSQIQHLDSGISEVGFTTEMRQQLQTGNLLLGTTITRPGTWYHLTTTSGTIVDGAHSLAINTQPTLGAVYGEWSWHQSAAADVRIGLRANTDFVSHLGFAPRVTLNFHPAAATTITAGVGRTQQSIQSMLNEENLTSSIVNPALPVAAAANGPLARADEWELALTHQVGRTTSVSLDGYLRTWADVLIPAANTTGYFVTTTPNYGDGRSSGLLASLSTAQGRWVLRTTAGLASAIQRVAGGAYHVGFEQPWSWSGDLTYRAPTTTTIQLHWATGAGQPATAVLPAIEWQAYAPANGSGEIEGVASNLPGAINALRLPGLLRVDLGLRHVWSIGVTSGHGGLSTALRVVNLLNQANPAGLVSRADGSLQLLRGTPRGLVFELGWVY